MKSSPRLTDWLETHWVVPAFGGGVLASFAIAFFGAATNTMAGWLYAISGVIAALLGVGAFLPPRSLRQLVISRLPIDPVTAGDDLTVEIDIHNRSSAPKSWLQVQDNVPSVLAKPQEKSIELITPQGSHRWQYYLPTTQRGIYRWNELALRTGSPLGLFWCRRYQVAPIKAIVYPQILPLNPCPLVDNLGKDESTQRQSDRLYHSASEGVTKTIRDYRYGDPTRLIHWRTSARFDQFKVRELETITGGQEIGICLDSGIAWSRDRFESAVIVAASLYFYAGRCQLNAKLWTANTGLLQGNRVVLEALASVEPGETTQTPDLPDLPLIWITHSLSRLSLLPLGSRWVLLPAKSETIIPRSLAIPGLLINAEDDLQSQLQSPIR